MKLAKAIATKVGDGTKAVDCLRWKRNLGSARKGSGGTRDAATLYANLKVTEKIDTDIPHILIDDAKASGGHFQACAAMLSTKSAEIEAGFCAGHTVHEPPPAAFAIVSESLPDFCPLILED